MTMPMGVFPFNLMLSDFTTTSVNQSFCCCQNVKLSLSCCQLSIQSRYSTCTSRVFIRAQCGTQLWFKWTPQSCCPVVWTPLVVVVVVLCLTSFVTFRNQQSNITPSSHRWTSLSLYHSIHSYFCHFSACFKRETAIYTFSSDTVRKQGFGV